MTRKKSNVRINKRGNLMQHNHFQEIKKNSEYLFVRSGIEKKGEDSGKYYKIMPIHLSRCMKKINSALDLNFRGHDLSLADFYNLINKPDQQKHSSSE